MNFLAIDPGKTTGWAYWNTEESQFPTHFGEGNEVEFYNYLDGMIIVPDTVVYENYRIRINPKQKGFSHAWSEGQPIQVIGAIKYWALTREVPLLVKQEVSCLKPGAGFGNIPVPKGHIKDHLSAMAHGFYYLVKNGVIKPIGK